jgi:hypothetical protein
LALLIQSGSRAFLIGQLLSVLAWITLAALVIVGVELRALFGVLGAAEFAGVFLAARGHREAGLPSFGPRALAQASVELGLRPGIVIGFDVALTLAAIALTILAFMS